ncbi:DUF2237 family protein [Salinisphaera sp. LB1]|uniref:DUF2237 family protein n=1 Tax=Salinisphaera sp. LB1 TaxID=2183911 RepID=UPI000D707C38|nr:DUF2237 domain-containing protein [Salinisphaera sp. LB1]AWN15409.1 hypothetical protein SALB1_1202 [Salinisphaera sp. LB1]
MSTRAPVSTARNVLGEPLIGCCDAPITGFYRDGFCHTGPEDAGRHVVCAVMTDDFLAFSAARGNDLATPRPAFDFPGLDADDRWCLCAARWAEAFAAGVPPRVALTATHEAALEIVPLADLKAHAIDLS